MPGLPHPFYRLPVQLDAERMLAEVRAIDPLEWRPDRFGIPAATVVAFVRNLEAADFWRSPGAGA